jgi:hypothetical protein
MRSQGWTQNRATATVSYHRRRNNRGRGYERRRGDELNGWERRLKEQRGTERSRLELSEEDRRGENGRRREEIK